MKYTIIDYLLSMTNCFSCNSILSANFFINDSNSIFINDSHLFQSKYNNGNLEIFRKRFKKNDCICIDKLNKVFYKNIKFDKILIRHLCINCGLEMISAEINYLLLDHLSQINCFTFSKETNNYRFAFDFNKLTLRIKNVDDRIIIKDIDFEDAKAKAKQFEQNQIFY